MNIQTTLSALRSGQPFRFTYASTVYRARGNGWYMGIAYDGGPWHKPQDTPVLIDGIEDAWEAHLAHEANV